MCSKRSPPHPRTPHERDIGTIQPIKMAPDFTEFHTTCTLCHSGSNGSTPDDRPSL